ncbi:hypothetical protein Dimus_003672 [Dionaea muscipula]
MGASLEEGFVSEEPKQVKVSGQGGRICADILCVVDDQVDAHINTVDFQSTFCEVDFQSSLWKVDFQSSLWKVDFKSSLWKVDFQSSLWKLDFQSSL